MLGSEQYQKLVPEILATIKKLQNENEGWELLSEGDCKSYKRNDANGVLTKGITEVNYPYNQVAAFIDNPETFKKTNENCIEVKKLAEKKGDYQIYYNHFKTPPPLENRDTVAILIRREEGNKIYLGAKSCNYPYPSPDKVVRAELKISGWVVEKKTDKSCLLKHFFHMDPSGSIPDMLKSKMAEMRSQLAGKIEPLMKQQGL